jgi:hypothetical protein
MIFSQFGFIRGSLLLFSCHFPTDTALFSFGFSQFDTIDWGKKGSVLFDIPRRMVGSTQPIDYYLSLVEDIFFFWMHVWLGAAQLFFPRFSFSFSWATRSLYIFLFFNSVPESTCVYLISSRYGYGKLTLAYLGFL